jgi:hypothetical protein
MLIVGERRRNMVRSTSGLVKRRRQTENESVMLICYLMNPVSYILARMALAINMIL